jgi:hypothetical protein
MGPSLTQFGVSYALANRQLELRDATAFTHPKSKTINPDFGIKKG